MNLNRALNICKVQSDKNARGIKQTRTHSMYLSYQVYQKKQGHGGFKHNEQI